MNERSVLPNVLTPVEPQQLLHGLAYAWLAINGSLPSRKSLMVLISQITLECGAGLKSCHSWNLGNLKASANDSFVSYYRCNEILNTLTAEKLIASQVNDGGKCYIDEVATAKRTDGKKIVWFEPNNKYCCFKAYKSLEDGCAAHLTFLKNRYKPESGIWASIVDGAPERLCNLLKQNHYFTADLEIYKNSVVQLFNQFNQKLKYTPNAVLIDDDDKQSILNNIGMMNLLMLDGANDLDE